MKMDKQYRELAQNGEGSDIQLGSCTCVFFLFLCFVSVWFQTLVSCSLVNSAHMVSFGEVLGDAVTSGKGGAPRKALISGLILWKCQLDRLAFVISSKM